MKVPAGEEDLEGGNWAEVPLQKAPTEFPVVGLVVGPDHKSFLVNYDELVNTSTVFRELVQKADVPSEGAKYFDDFHELALAAGFVDGVGALQAILELPDDDPVVVDHFVHWLHADGIRITVRDSNDPPPTIHDFVEDLLNFHHFACKNSVETTLRNAIVDIMQDVLEAMGRVTFPVRFLDLIYDHDNLQGKDKLREFSAASLHAALNWNTVTPEELYGAFVKYPLAMRDYLEGLAKLSQEEDQLPKNAKGTSLDPHRRDDDNDKKHLSLSPHSLSYLETRGCDPCRFHDHSDGSETECPRERNYNHHGLLYLLYDSEHHWDDDDSEEDGEENNREGMEQNGEAMDIDEVVKSKL